MGALDDMKHKAEDLIDKAKDKIDVLTEKNDEAEANAQGEGAMPPADQPLAGQSSEAQKTPPIDHLVGKADDADAPA